MHHRCSTLFSSLLARPARSVGECSRLSPVTVTGIKSCITVCSRPHSSVSDVYQSMVTNGTLQPDNHQLEVVTHLQLLQRELEGHLPAGNGTRPSWIHKIFGGKNVSRSKVKGMYMHGSVGAGKTMLMDMFYRSTRVHKKQRLHFNEFMMDAHKRIHRFKQELLTGLTGPRPSSRHPYDPITPVAHDIASSVDLLCFDEFQVTDIGDAMILKRLFTTLFEDGVVVVATSNRPPDDLYKRGLQRGNFLPFIDILKDNCHIVNLSPNVDYRQSIIRAAGGVYLNPSSDANSHKLEELFIKFSEENGSNIVHKRLDFFGRHLLVKRSAGKIAFFTFSELCDQPLSAVDFLEICRAFEIVFVEDIPRLTIAMRSQARRFITLVDTLYDHKVKLICTANSSPRELFLQPDNEVGGASSDEQRALMDDLGIDLSTASQTSIFTGEEELFASARTVSRLTEMQGTEYWESDHILPRD